MSIASFGLQDDVVDICMSQRAKARHRSHPLPPPPPPPNRAVFTFTAAVAAQGRDQFHEATASFGLQGDRVGICMTQLDASLVERGIACTPGAVPTFTGAIAAVEKIRFFVGQVPSRLKVHVTVGHQTVMGDIQFFGMPETAGPAPDEASSILGRMEELTTKVSYLLWCAGNSMFSSALSHRIPI